MFTVTELRLIRNAVYVRMEDLKKRKAIVDPESDDSIEATNDLMLLKIILEKIKERPAV